MNYKNKMMTTNDDAIVRHLLDLIEQFKEKNPKIVARAKEFIDKVKGNNEEKDRRI